MARLDLSSGAVREALQERREEERIADEAERLKGDFRRFVEAAWPVIEPGTVFVPNWHIDAICDLIEQVRRGKITRLLINVPPRHMKSLIVSVLYPAWCWTFAPRMRFLTASYAASLAEGHAVKSRDVIMSDWYQERWPGVILKSDVNRQGRYGNTETGQRIATGIGGEATGEGGDVIIIDDPIKIDDAFSDGARARVRDWHDRTMSTRLNDLTTGVEIIVMQRLHEDDLAGHVLGQGGFTHFCAPARFERNHPFLWPDERRTDDGELLWPAHVPEAALVEIERRMGSFFAAGQLQQRPAPVLGGILKRDRWRFFNPDYLAHDRAGLLPRFEMIVSSWDTAFDATPTADFVVGQAWGVHRSNRYLLRSFRARADLPQTIAAMLEMRAWLRDRWPNAAIATVVEKSANAPEIVRQLKQAVTGVIARPVTANKNQRAVTAQPLLEAGNIYLPGALVPESAVGYRAEKWVEDFIDETAVFPNGKNDDQVDAFSQAIIYAEEHQTMPMRSYVPRGRIDGGHSGFDPNIPPQLQRQRERAQRDGRVKVRDPLAL